jgi:uncharacterized protein with GYD domain
VRGWRSTNPQEAAHAEVPGRGELHRGRHQGVQSAGGSSRRDAIAALAESVGGQLESFYFAFGERDVYTVVDLPDNESATAVALTVNASGAVKVRTTVLLTPEEVDAAAKRSVEYRAPGA